MTRSADIMGMPISITIADPTATNEIFDQVFAYFRSVDEQFSTYKPTSEISRINRGEILQEEYSEEMKEVFAFSEETKKLTNGYFDIVSRDGTIDPSGLVKGWAIYHAAILIGASGFENFFVEAGGDIQCMGKNEKGELWSFGIRNPFQIDQIVKVVKGSNIGIATSGTYLRGQHIYNPHNKTEEINEIKSLTVIGPNIYEADRFATAAFAMGEKGIQFIENLNGFEGYMIDAKGMATMTSEFEQYVT